MSLRCRHGHPPAPPLPPLADLDAIEAAWAEAEARWAERSRAVWARIRERIRSAR